MSRSKASAKSKSPEEITELFLKLASKNKDAETKDVDLAGELQGALARGDFLLFRNIIRPKLLSAWWQVDVAHHLIQFWEDFKAGLRPSLILQAPPQHGKTEQIIDFIAWCAGNDPSLRTIFGSYSDDLGSRVNITLQRIFDSENYASVFANTKLSDAGTPGKWLRNSSLLEYVGHEGSFRNTTVMGQINGQGLDLGFIDDPIKGRAEAQSKAVREKTWSWFTDDFFGRFSERAGFIMIMTRWHLDDPVGRWIEHFPNTKVLKYPAIAIEDDDHRRAGEPLFPELKSLEFLEQRKQVLTQASWESIYQQSPIVAGGELFPVEQFKIVPAFDRHKIKRSVRYVDKAGTQDGGAYTAAALVHLMMDGTTVVEDMLRGQWSALEREQRLLQAAEIDKLTCPRYSIWFEQEPGSGGKESAESSVRRFHGYQVFTDKVTGSKEVRAEPYAAQVQAGNVYLKSAEWNREFIDEHEQFPAGKYKDQVDSTAGAFNKLASAASSYDRTLSWVG
jgi:predicted phage terminase large subunit-like protein